MKDVQVYRLCRNSRIIEKLKKEENVYNLPKTIYLKDIDLYEFIRFIIKNEKGDFVLLCHEDVILPMNIRENINECINSANSTFGEKSWGVIGNAGLEIISKKTVTYLSDPHTTRIPPKTTTPTIVESIDGNTMLLNLANLREKGVTMPENLSGYHLYDLILCMETYKSGLLCAASSYLYTMHQSKGNYQTFKEAVVEKQYQEYFRSSFTNHTVTTINDLIDVKREYKYLSTPGSNLKSFEDTILMTLRELFKKRLLNLNIIVRIHKQSEKLFRLLESISTFERKLPDNTSLKVYFSVNNINIEEIKDFIESVKGKYINLDISTTYISSAGKQYPRVKAIKEVIQKIESKNSYVWIVDYDDFVMPELAKYLQFLLKDTRITVGDSYVFEELWEKGKVPIKSEMKNKIDAKGIKNVLSGKNYIPICSVIYPAKIIKSIFEKNKLEGDYFEDYAILLLALKHNFQWFPIPFAGISYHGRNTVLEDDRTHWDYSYTTFLAEVVNTGLVSTASYAFYEGRENIDSLEFEGFKKGLIWRTLIKYRVFKSYLRSLLPRKTN